MTAATPVRVLVVEDHPVFRFGLCAVLAQRADIVVVGEATTGEDAIVAAADLHPDVVIMDLDLDRNGLTGADATRAITNARPETAVLVLTMFEDSEWVFRAMRAGARGYLLKGTQPAELLHAVDAVARGEAIFGRSIATRVLRYFNDLPPSTAAAFPELTAREREILAYIAEGRSNPDIARTLTLSGKTVRNHVSQIFAKLRVADRAQAIVRAREAGLGRKPGTEG